MASFSYSHLMLSKAVDAVEANINMLLYILKAISTFVIPAQNELIIVPMELSDIVQVVYWQRPCLFFLPPNITSTLPHASNHSQSS